MKQLFVFLIAFMNVLPSFAQSDKTNCIDHPVITRYPGAVIDYCDTQIYKEYRIAKGPETGYRTIGDWINTAGKNTRIYYSIKGDRTVSEVYKNYTEALRNGSFDILAGKLHTERNVSAEVGGASWLVTFYNANPFPSSANIKINHGSSTVGGTFYIAGKSNKDSGGVYVVVSGKQYTDTEVVVLLDVIEENTAETNFIKVDADYMAKQLKETGRVALQGVHFDFNKSTIKSESEPLLAEIAKMLKDNAAFKLFVVGHTDMIGELAYNLELSSKRAAEVVNFLVNSHGIDINRLSSHGVGPLSPVATNGTEPGRTMNRRVELVLR